MWNSLYKISSGNAGIISPYFLKLVDAQMIFFNFLKLSNDNFLTIFINIFSFITLCYIVQFPSNFKFSSIEILSKYTCAITIETSDWRFTTKLARVDIKVIKYFNTRDNGTCPKLSPYCTLSQLMNLLPAI